MVPSMAAAHSRAATYLLTRSRRPCSPRRIRVPLATSMLACADAGHGARRIVAHSERPRTQPLLIRGLRLPPHHAATMRLRMVVAAQRSALHRAPRSRRKARHRSGVSSRAADRASGIGVAPSEPRAIEHCWVADASSHTRVIDLRSVHHGHRQGVARGGATVEPRGVQCDIPYCGAGSGRASSRR